MRKTKSYSRLFGILSILAFMGVVGLLCVVGLTAWGLHHYSRGLPEYSQLEDYEPPTVTRIHAGDGRLLAEYAEEQRVFVPIGSIPTMVVNAFIAAEDKNFSSHPGVDVFGVGRAVIQNIGNVITGRRMIGASTITQQVAKNFLLTNEVSINRKIKEIILAVRIERALLKDRIMELYLNEIYLGKRSYGVAAAALNYFNKSLEDLTINEVAFLAGLPKAPNAYHPEHNTAAAIGRRNYVLGRMLEDGYIDKKEFSSARTEDLLLRVRNKEEVVHAPFFAEEVRRKIAETYGESILYRGGLSVRTTIRPQLQKFASDALQDGLISYDKKHGWRGPVSRISDTTVWMTELSKIVPPPAKERWHLAVVLRTETNFARIGFRDGTEGSIPLTELTWARSWREGQKLGPEITSVSQVLSPGDVIFVEGIRSVAEESGPLDPIFSLCQVPEVEGALLALDPHTGRVLAMVGGWSFQESQFNRATQAQRQPGSAFKPFVYLAAIEAGYTPASVVLDAPFVIDQGSDLGVWKPENYGREFGGPSTLRLGIEKSKNLMTVRLANSIGMERVLDVARRFDIGQFPPHLSIALGSGETTLLRLTAAYAMIINGGKRVQPALIERIQDRDGRTIMRRDQRECTECQGPLNFYPTAPRLIDYRSRVTDPATAFQVTWMLKGVVERGTGRTVRELGRPLAGKTGTTNDSLDAWFIGFSPDLVAGVFIGFDKPRSLGVKQTGSNVAAPVFKRFMELATKDQPPVPFRIPRGIRMVRIDAENGNLPDGKTERLILEAFKPGTEPSRNTNGVASSRDEQPSKPVEGSSRFDSGLY